MLLWSSPASLTFFGTTTGLPLPPRLWQCLCSMFNPYLSHCQRLQAQNDVTAAFSATVGGGSLCAESLQAQIQGQATAARSFLSDFFTSLFNYRPQADHATLIRPWSMLRSYFMMPADCIPVIITHHSITLAFKKANQHRFADSLYGLLWCPDLSIMFASPGKERIDFLSNPPKGFLFTHHSQSSPHPQHWNWTSVESNNTLKSVCQTSEQQETKEKKSITRKLKVFVCSALDHSNFVL